MSLGPAAEDNEKNLHKILKMCFKGKANKSRGKTKMLGSFLPRKGHDNSGRSAERHLNQPPESWGQITWMCPLFKLLPKAMYLKAE